MPTAAEVHIDRALTSLAIDIPVGKFIVAKFFPDLRVQKKSDKFFIFDVLRRKSAAITDSRAPGAKANEIEFSLSTGSYNTEGHALAGLVTDEEYENADDPLDPQANLVEQLFDRLNTIKEIRAKVKLDAAITSSGQTAAPTNAWNVAAGTPIEDINLGINVIEDAIGMTPNVMGMDAKVFRALKEHADLVDRVKHTGTNDAPASVTAKAIAELFELDAVVVGSAVKNTAVEAQTASVSRVWADTVYLAYVPPRPGLKIPALGYNFLWEGMSGNVEGWTVGKYRPEGRHGDMLEVSNYSELHVTLGAAVYSMTTVLS